MEDTLFDTLDMRLDVLIRKCEQLERMNQHLIHEQATLTAARDELLEKHQRAIEDIQSIILRLEELEGRTHE